MQPSMLSKVRGECQSVYNNDRQKGQLPGHGDSAARPKNQQQDYKKVLKRQSMETVTFGLTVFIAILASKLSTQLSTKSTGPSPPKLPLLKA